MGYYLEDHQNPTVAQYGWPRTKVSGVIGVHTTESGVVFSGADPGAENTAAFIGRRSDHGSYHIMADWDTIVPLVRPTFAAWADTTNNVHALSVSGAMNAARWRDLTPERAAGIVRNMGIAAAMLARDAVAHGVLKEVPPARRITAQQAISGSAAGFYGHGETNPGTRYDPGQNFDWDLFLATYAAAVGGGINYQGTIITPLEEDDMFTDEDRKTLTDARNEATNAKLNAADAKQIATDARNEATNAKLHALSALQAATSLLQTRLPDPNQPDGYQPSLAEWIVYGNLKAGGAQQVASSLTPELIAAAVAKASSEVDAQAIADRLTVTVKEG